MPEAGSQKVNRSGSTASRNVHDIRYLAPSSSTMVFSKRPPSQGSIVTLASGTVAPGGGQ